MKKYTADKTQSYIIILKYIYCCHSGGFRLSFNNIRYYDKQTPALLKLEFKK